MHNNFGVLVSMIDSSKICFVTHNTALQRNRRLVKSLSKKYTVNLVRRLINENSNKLLQLNMNSAFRLSQLGLMSFATSTPMFLDVLAGIFFPSKLKNYIIDYPTPLSVELAWLGHKSLSKFIDIQERLLLRNARAVLVPNELVAKRAKDYGATNITVIPNYPSANFQPTIESLAFRKQIGIPEKSKVAVFTAAGRLEEIYGLTLLLESWKIVEKNNPDTVLVIIGPRHDSEISGDDLVNRAKALGIKNLRVTGYLSALALPDWINMADVCLAPRTKGFPIDWYNDKDSTKISEYAALKKPIVATGYSHSDQYLLVDQTPDGFAEGITKVFENETNLPEPHFWEQNEPLLLDSTEQLFAK